MSDLPSVATRRPIPRRAILFGLAAGAAAAFGFSVHPGWFIAAIPPCAMAIGLVALRPPLIRVQWDSDGLLIDSGRERIPFESIQSLTLAGWPQDPLRAEKLKDGPLCVVHAGGALELLGVVDPPAKQLYCRLLAESTMPGSDDVAAPLRKHLADERERFGPDKVWTFCRRNYLGRSASTWKGRVCSLMLIFSGVLCPIVASRVPEVKKDLAEWIVGGIIMVVGGAVAWIFWALNQGSHVLGQVHAKGRASLIVSPSGIALVQDDLSGIMRWDELHDVRIVLSSPFHLRAGALELKADGAKIHVLDIFDRPLPVIGQVIRRFWRGPATAQTVMKK